MNEGLENATPAMPMASRRAGAFLHLSIGLVLGAVVGFGLGFIGYSATDRAPLAKEDPAGEEGRLPSTSVTEHSFLGIVLEEEVLVRGAHMNLNQVRARSKQLWQRRLIMVLGAIAGLGGALFGAVIGLNEGRTDRRA